MCVSGTLSAYILLTHDGGKYVSFHRAVEGRLSRYPLYFHLQDEDPDPLDDPISTCATCGRPGPDLMEDPMDIEQGNLYCNRGCIAQMDRVRQTRARMEAQALEEAARRQGLPPGVRVSPRRGNEGTFI